MKRRRITRRSFPSFQNPLSVRMPTRLSNDWELPRHKIRLSTELQMTEHFIDLKDLRQDKVSVNGSIEPGSIDFSAEGIRQVKPLEWNATAERAGIEIRIAGSLQTTMETACSRCLEPARYEVSKAFDLFFRQKDEFMFDEDDEIELTEKDTRTAF